MNLAGLTDDDLGARLITAEDYDDWDTVNAILEEQTRRLDAE